MGKKKGIDISELSETPFTPSEVSGVVKILKRKITKAERREQFEKSTLKIMEDAAKKYPKDIGILWNDYKELETQGKSEKFLAGYYSAISDLIIIKKLI